MEMLYLKTDLMSAMKNKNELAKEALSLYISRIKNRAIELRTTVEEMPEVEGVQALQKMIKETEDERDAFAKAGRAERVERLAAQIELLKKYLPRQLTEDEVKEIFNKLEDKSMPAVMKYFKANYAGQVDMSMVSRIARG